MDRTSLARSFSSLHCWTAFKGFCIHTESFKSQPQCIFPPPQIRIRLLRPQSIWTHHHVHGTRNHNIFGFGVLCTDVGANRFTRPGRVLPCILRLSAVHHGFGVLLAILQTQDIQRELSRILSSWILSCIKSENACAWSEPVSEACGIHTVLTSGG